MEPDLQPEAYLIHVWIREIHPMLWRRFLVRSDCTLADFHVVLQIGFEWTDFHLHRFRIRKKDYAVPRLGGLACAHDARELKLADLHFRINERFLYEYDFSDLWQHQVWIEKRLQIATSRSYPLCVGGQWAGPPEACGGPKAFLERRAAAPCRVRELLDDLLEGVNARDTEALAYCLEELQPWQAWLLLYRFDRRRVNRRLRQYAEGAPGSMNSRGGWQ
jgi:Plasmid pRiA4b ORF-3-like protein